MATHSVTENEVSVPVSVDIEAPDIRALLDVRLDDATTWPEAMHAAIERTHNIDLRELLSYSDEPDDQAWKNNQMHLLVEQKLAANFAYVDLLTNALRPFLPTHGLGVALLIRLDDARIDAWVETIAVATKIEREMGDMLPIGRYEPVLARVMAL